MGSEITKDVLVSVVDRLVAALSAHTAAITDHMETMQSVDASLSGIEDGLNDLLGRAGTTNYLESHTKAVAELEDALRPLPRELLGLNMSSGRHAKGMDALSEQLALIGSELVSLNSNLQDLEARL